MAVIGFNQTTYTFEEGDGTVEVCAAFLDPGQTAPNVVVELMGSISPSTYHTCCVKVSILCSHAKEGTHAWAKHLLFKSVQFPEGGNGHSQVLFCIQPRKSANVKMFNVTSKQIAEQHSERHVTMHDVAGGTRVHQLCPSTKSN